MKPVKLSDLIEALEFDSDEHGHWVDRETGRVIMLEHDLVGAVETSDDEELAQLADWEKEHIEQAKALVEDPGKRFEPAPTKFDFHEYRHIERFIGTVKDDRVSEQLWRAIKGSGAFRRFKLTVERLGLREDWFAYRDAAMRQFVRIWAEVHEVPLVEDWPPKENS
jgi:hypothetical protein